MSLARNLPNNLNKISLKKVSSYNKQKNYSLKEAPKINDDTEKEIKLLSRRLKKQSIKEQRMKYLHVLSLSLIIVVLIVSLFYLVI